MGLRGRRVGLVSSVVAVAIAMWYCAALGVAHVASFAAELDDAVPLAQLGPRPQATLVFDRYGREAFSFFAEQRIDVPLERVSPVMVDALVAVEDRRFFSHRGLDPVRIAGAAWRNVRAGRIVQGGSTITQQLARASTLLTRERTYGRKLREIAVAVQIEERYGKHQILEQYLNAVYFGTGFHGVEAAARGYFGKPASDLLPHEAALLAALVRSPSTDAPGVSAARALKRRNLVLRLMRAQGRLTQAAFDAAIAAPLPAAGRARPQEASGLASARHSSEGYFREEVRQQLVALFGSGQVLRGGLRVYTTYDPDLQAEAARAVSTRIAQIARRVRAARDLQGSFVAMDPVSGDVYALVGGRDFDKSPFNRATQARRQAGSAFKPIIFAAAIERGFAPGTILRDLETPIRASTGDWLPSGEHEAAEYTLRRAMKLSSNRAAAQLLQQVGVSTAVYYAQRLGIASELPRVPSLALGTGEVSLLELTAAYSAFANQGRVAKPRFITRVEDAHGSTIYVGDQQHTQAISPATAFLMSSMLADVVAGGTATGARAAGFRLPAAGKTGTTDDYADAWFIGYTPRLLAGTWFGLDMPAPIMRGGFAGTVAVPAWGQFMRAATAGAKPEWYKAPDSVERVAICRVTGARATDACRAGHRMGGGVIPAGFNAEWPPILPVASGPPLPPDEPPVYEDYFPIAMVPTERCWLEDDGSTMFDR